MYELVYVNESQKWKSGGWVEFVGVVEAAGMVVSTIQSAFPENQFFDESGKSSLFIFLRIRYRFTLEEVSSESFLFGNVRYVSDAFSFRKVIRDETYMAKLNVIKVALFVFM